MESIKNILKNVKSSDEVKKLFVDPELNKDHVHDRQVDTSRTRRQFCKVYEGFVDELLNMSGMEVKVLLYLGLTMDFNKSRIIMDAEFWDKIEKHFNMSRQYLRRILTALKNKGFIYDDKMYLYVSSKYVAKRRA